MLVSVDTAGDLAETLLRRAGVPDGAAADQARLLVVAEAKGVPSHGLLRLPRLLRRIDNGTAAPVRPGTHDGPARRSSRSTAHRDWGRSSGSAPWR